MKRIYRILTVAALVFSFWAAVQAVGYYIEGQFPQSFVYGLLAFAIFAFSITSSIKLSRSPNRVPQVKFSRVVCSFCGWTVLRVSNPDDRAGKEVGRCPKCAAIVKVGGVVETDAQRPRDQRKDDERHMERCVRCGARLSRAQRFCGDCGEDQFAERPRRRDRKTTDDEVESY